MLYGKGGFCLYLFLYSQTLDNTFKTKAYALLRRIFDSLSSDVPRHFIHISSLGFFLEYLKRNNMIPNGSFEFSEEIDAFLLDLILDDVTVQKSCDLLGTLNYLNTRIRQSSVLEATKNDLDAAIVRLVLRANTLYSNQLNNEVFWNPRWSLSYYEYNYDVHNYLNYLEVIGKHTSCAFAGTSALVSETLTGSFETLKGRVFAGRDLSEAFCESATLKHNLQLLRVFSLLKERVGADSGDGEYLLYLLIKRKFYELSGDLPLHELLTAISHMRKLTRIPDFDFGEEVANLMIKLRGFLNGSNFIGVYRQRGIPDLGLANGLSGILITLLGNELTIDDDWDVFLSLN